MIRLNMQQVLMLHEELIQETGGIHGLRDENLLGSALAAPFQTFNDQPLYPSLQQKAVRLCYGLVIDGNKRIGAHVMLVFLALNGIELAYTQEELSSIILRVAAGEAGATELLKWLMDHEETGSV